MRIYILRAPSGGGKTTYANLLKLEEEDAGHTVAIVSTDHFFEDDDGNYKFDVSKLGEAHAATLRRYVGLINPADGGSTLDVLIVDNTNCSIAELAPYVALGTAYGHTVEIFVLLCDVRDCIKRTIHGVAAENVVYQHRVLDKNYELPAFWPRQKVVTDAMLDAMAENE